MAVNQWTNPDGLTIRYGDDQYQWSRPVPTETCHYGVVRQLVLTFKHDEIPDVVIDSDNDGTLDAFDLGITHIPANAYIKSAILIVTEDWATGDSATLGIGLKDVDGNVIDADGIDAAIAASALDLGDVVDCDGALVASGVTIGTDAGFIYATVNTGTFTTGEATLVLEYMEPHVQTQLSA